MAAKRGISNDPLWFKDAIIYELPVKSFYDGNDDGIGDFKGAIQKLDYLQELGVTCLWVLPFFPSPLRDDGYDIANYCSVHPSYGTLDDFKQFLEFLGPANQKVLAYVRRYERDVILCVANLSRSVQPVQLDLRAFAGLTPVEMMGYTDFPPIGAESYFLTLGPYDFYWFELQHRAS